LTQRLSGHTIVVSVTEGVNVGSGVPPCVYVGVLVTVWVGVVVGVSVFVAVGVVVGVSVFVGV
jgi:hypothetical protein